jgi:mannose-6-phosphate isomerase-like protein (cupin superfamily)
MPIIAGAGRAAFTDTGGAVGVGPGDTLFVPAGVEHRFSEISEDFAAVVVFGPPEDSRA